MYDNLYLSKVKGRSMNHLLEEGDAVIYVMDSQRVRFGNLIVYQSSLNNDIVCHRMFFNFGDKMLIAGDNCIKFEFVPKKKLIGVVKYIHKKNGMLITADCENKHIRDYTRYIFKSILFYRILLLSAVVFKKPQQQYELNKASRQYILLYKCQLKKGAK